ncbi:MAG: lysophospholipid acyltransferase family protein, partial [Anaerolineales bacterium]
VMNPELPETDSLAKTLRDSTMATYSIPRYLRVRRSALKLLFRQVFRVLYRVRIVGKENIPASGAYLIAHNHVSIVDPAFILSFWPLCAEVIGTTELWRRPGQNIIVGLYGTIPVKRDGIDRQLIKKTVAILQADFPLVIAPEGTRSHTPGMQRANPGIAYLVDRGQAPVLPVGVVGSTDEEIKKALWGRRPVLEMRIGKAFTLPPLEGRGKARRDARQENADLVMMRIAELLPLEYQGVYADHAFTRPAEAA